MRKRGAAGAEIGAGILAYQVGEDGSLLVLLVHPGGPFWKNKDAHAWSIPKGEHEPEEDPEAAAVREFGEELGFPLPDGVRHDLGTVRQSGGKQVQAWAVRTGHLATEHVVSNRFEMEWPPKSGTRQEFPEVDRAEWMTIPEATGRVVSAQAEFLERLATLVSSSEDGGTT